MKKWLHIIKNVTKAANAFIKVTLGTSPTSLPYFENKITFPIASNLFFLFKCYIYYSQGTSDDIYNTVGLKVRSTLDFFRILPLSVFQNGGTESAVSRLAIHISIFGKLIQALL